MESMRGNVYLSRFADSVIRLATVLELRIHPSS